MADVHDRATRSRNMAAIRGADTKPEKSLRSALHRLGFRFRLHPANLPGRPDFVLPRFRVAVFVHGCFWHGHDCPLFRFPATHREFWSAKIMRNRARDAEVKLRILESGWRHLSVWECALRGRRTFTMPSTATRAARWIRSGRMEGEIRGTRGRVRSN